MQKGEKYRIERAPKRQIISCFYLQLSMRISLEMEMYIRLTRRAIEQSQNCKVRVGDNDCLALADIWSIGNRPLTMNESGFDKVDINHCCQ